MKEQEKSIDDAYEPLLTWIRIVSRSGDWLRQFGQDAEEQNELMDKMDNYASWNYSPAIKSLDGRDVLQLLGPNRRFKNTLENVEMLLSNFFAMPGLLEDMLWIMRNTNDGKYMNQLSVAHKEFGRNGQDMAFLSMIEDVLKQFHSTLIPTIGTSRWGIKSLMTYFFMKHSHKIQLSNVVQKVFELTDISDEIDVSKDFNLPYPMNYIEFNKAIEFEDGERHYKVTGALLFKVDTKAETNDDKREVYTWEIEDFPREDLHSFGSVNAIVPNTALTGGGNIIDYKYDKAYFPGFLFERGDCGKMFKYMDYMVNDKYNSYAGSIPTEELVNSTSHFLPGGLPALMSAGFKGIAHEGIFRLLGTLSSIMRDKSTPEDIRQKIPAIQKEAHDCNTTLLGLWPDPFYEQWGNVDKSILPKTESYTVIELIVECEGGNPDSLFHDVGPYIEIGRREGGDKWSVLKKAFGHTMETYADTDFETPFLKGFRLAIQSIWFINEPDVKLVKPKETAEQMRRRKYFGKTKVPNQRKIVLRGETKRYLKNLSRQIRSSPKGTYWVRGHRRNQWYASIKEHKRVWIKPYVKGKGTNPAVKKQVDLDPNNEA